MYCSHCGRKNDNNSKFCSSCEKELITVEENNSFLHNSIIRKSIKKDAMEKNKDPLYLGNIIMFTTVIITLIVVVLSFGEKAIASSGGTNYSLNLSTSGFLKSLIIYIIFMSVILYFTLGMNKISLDISRDKKTSIGSMFKYPFQKITIYLKILGINTLIYLLLELLTYIPVVGIILYLILTIYLSPILVMFIYIMIDNTNISIRQAIKKAISVTKGKKVAYYALILSFAGWYLLSIFTLGLLTIWIMPYINVAISNFYLYITNEKKYKAAPKGISNGAIIGITIGIYVLFIIIITFAIFTYAFINEVKEEVNKDSDIIIEDNYIDYFDNNISGKTINISGLDVFIPDEYKEITLENYEKAYMSNEENIVIGLINYDIGYNISASDYANTYKSSFSSSYSCGNLQASDINHYNWETLECNGVGVNIQNYIAIQNNRLYLLIISYDNNSFSKAERIINHIEKNLMFSNIVA